ncbi:MAG: DUF4062 domain-containing protein [Bryobacteraceae bacterium]|jgi:hypothetical protein
MKRAKVGVKKPYVPIFVGSTFSDMQVYRRAVRDALAQLETMVRGMEQFGSKPGSPVDECLQVVRSCQVYVGLFGMRYGSVPDGNEKSMTHLEYEQAQAIKLPSLIYLIDEENQPVLPKDVEFGPGAEKLRSLKETLKRQHTVTFFTTPESLRAGILHDVPELLKSMGAEVGDELDLEAAQSDAETLNQFRTLPKMFAGRPVVIEFATRGSFHSAYPDACSALGLEIGATVVDNVKLSNGIDMLVFAERDLALKLCRIPKGSIVQASAVTAFGAYQQVFFTEDDAVVKPDTEIGLIIKNVLDIKSRKEKTAE